MTAPPAEHPMNCPVPEAMVEAAIAILEEELAGNHTSVDIVSCAQRMLDAAFAPPRTEDGEHIQATLTVPGHRPVHARPEPRHGDPHMGTTGAVGRVDLGYIDGAPVRLQGDVAYLQRLEDAARHAWASAMRFEGRDAS